MAHQQNLPPPTTFDGAVSPKSVAKMEAASMMMHRADGHNVAQQQNQNQQNQQPGTPPILQSIKQANPFDDDDDDENENNGAAPSYSSGTTAPPTNNGMPIPPPAAFDDFLSSSPVNGGSRGVHPLLSGPAVHAPQEQQTQQQQSHPLLQTHPLLLQKNSGQTAAEAAPVTPETTTKQLASLAAALSKSKPRAMNEIERAEESAALARVTLGEEPMESTGTKRTHQAKPGKGGTVAGGGGRHHRRTGSVESIKNIVRSPAHRKAQSLGMADWMGIVDEVNEGGGGSRDNRDCNRRSGISFGGNLPSSPGLGKRGGSPKGGTGVRDSPRGTDKLGGMLGRLSLKRDPSATTGGGGLIVPSLPDLLNIGNPAASKAGVPAAPPASSSSHVVDPANAATTACVPSLRSSEQDPAPYQIELPIIDDVVRYGRMCAVLDNYRLVDQNFDFENLAGISRVGLEGFVGGATTDGASSFAATTSEEEGGGDGAASAALLQPAHRPIASSILECGTDVFVEGFFHELGSLDSVRKTEDDTGTRQDKATDDRVEVAVLSSQRHRQFVVVWRGPTGDQAKPVRNRHVKSAKDAMGKDVRSADLSADQPVPVFPAYRDSYLKDGLEDGVFALLDELADRTPFCDVVLTGHSYGAALATLAAVRYAASRPMMRVCCQTFGSPRVGGGEFRLWANSLPNLRVMRVEYGSDPWVYAPEGLPWSHVGSSIVVSSSVCTLPKPGSNSACENTSSSDRGDGTERGGGCGEPIVVVANQPSNKAAAEQPVRAYRFDHHRPSHAGGFLSRLGGHHGSKSERNDHTLDAYVTAIERIAHLGLPWVTDYVGEDAGKGVVSVTDHEKRLVV